jgi:hypothetical protein
LIKTHFCKFKARLTNMYAPLTKNSTTVISTCRL